MQNKPAYMIESVDHALRLAVLLQQDKAVRLTDAAAHLGVARSTAHRLLAMLVYRDFAKQAPDRRYQAGPVLQRGAAVEPLAQLRRSALPHLQALSDRCNETVNLQVLTGDHVRFIASVEPERVLRVGNREGRMLPAHLASGGRALLARHSDGEVAALYAVPGAMPVDMERLMQDLRRVRRRGFAINNQATEVGVTAIGQVVQAPDGNPLAALCIAIPTARFSRDRLTELSRMLAASVEHIEHDLATDSRPGHR